MKAYILAAVGVIFLTVIVSFVAPEGKLKKSVNFVLRLISIAVLIQPVTALFNFQSEASISDFDYAYVCQVYSQNQSRLVSQKVQEALGVACTVYVDIVYDGEKIEERGITVIADTENRDKLDEIQAYLEELGYIHITVNETRE